jgi:hypothetical protein
MSWLRDYDNNWLNSYDHIEYESDGESDFYDEYMTGSSYWDGTARGSLLSSAWSRGRQQKTMAEDVVRELIEIRTSVHNLLKVHGLPARTRVELAAIKGAGKGCAGFDDQENFLNPFILLDKAIYSEVSSAEVLDVYCGVAIHEAGHIWNTRELFKVLQSTSTDSIRLWINLLEDGRIERIEKERSPGFAAYIQAATRALFENKELGSGIDAWDDSSDMDRVRMLIFSFLRCPHLLTEEIKIWKSMTGFSVYDDLRKMLRAMPKTELEVAELAKEIDEYYRKVTKSLDKLTDDDAKTVAGDGDPSSEGSEESSAGGDKDADSESTDPTSREIMEALQRIRKHHKQREADKTEAEVVEEKKREEITESEKVGERTPDSAERTDGKDDKAEKRAKKHRKALDKIAENREGRFGELEIDRMLRRFGTVTEGLDLSESDALASFESERMTLGDDWSNPDGDAELTRKTVIVHPVAKDKENAARYKNAYDEVKDHVAKMRNVFRLRLGERNFTETERQEGRLHRRMIGRAMSTNRIFKRDYKRVAKGMSLCLVLDESGSMGSVGYTKTGDDRAGHALRVAVLIAEALKPVHGIDLEVYSYASCGENDKDNLVKYLYGKSNPDTASIGGYSSGCQNYDHVALKTAGDLFIENTDNDNRLMIVLSDGQPCGYDYGGRGARLATKNAVDDLERRGVKVLNVAIASFDSESMFKNVIRFLDMPDLINKMRCLVTNLVKGTS